MPLAALLGALPPTLMPCAAQAQVSAFVGRWHLNPALSRLPPGEAAPGDSVLEVVRLDPAHAHWSYAVTPPGSSEPDLDEFDIPANGEPYLIGGNTTAAVRLGPGSVSATFASPGIRSDSMTCMLAPNAQRMTCNGRIVGDDGTTSSYVDVFDRVATSGRPNP